MAATDAVPVTWVDLKEWIRRIAIAVNALRDGKGANTGSVTLTANQATTVVTEQRAGTDSVITFMPTTANAAAEIGGGAMYVSSRGDETFTITHANNAQSDRTFAYEVTG